MTVRESTESPEDAVEATEPDAGKDTGGGLRKQLEGALAENKELKTDARARAFKDAGLDTSNGLGKAISQVYEGAATQEAVAEFAKDEYGWQAPPSDAHPQAEQIATEQARVDDIGNTAGSIVPPSEADALATAEAAGDYGTTLNIKGQQMADMLKTRR
jgi:hypothetical protein